MTWWQRVRHRWRLEDELDAELRFHFDRPVADHVAAGLTEREARQRARVEFGGVEGIKDDCRQARGTRWVHDISSDLRFAARLLAKDRGATATAILVLGLGLGVHTTFFSIVPAHTRRARWTAKRCRSGTIPARPAKAGTRADRLCAVARNRIVDGHPVPADGSFARGAGTFRP